MRQAGILAAAGIYALDHNVQRLADDHRNARRFAQHLGKFRGIRLQADPVETNLVFFDVEETGHDAQEIARRLQKRGVRIGVETRYLMRAVFHLDVDSAAVQTALEALQEALN
jgi:threonine aldolase